MQALAIQNEIESARAKGGGVVEMRKEEKKLPSHSALHIIELLEKTNEEEGIGERHKCTVWFEAE